MMRASAGKPREAGDRPICIIPARGGSRRLPRKNIAPLAGKPLMGWIIEAALQSDIFDHVYVSTEDEEIAAKAEELGAELPYRRPSELANDSVGSPQVAADLVLYLQRKGQHYDSICLAEPVAPFFTAEDFRSAYGLFRSGHVDVLHTISRFPDPPQWALKSEGGCFTPMFGIHHHLKESQNLAPAYRVMGIVFVRTSHLLETRSAISNSMGGYLIKGMKTVTIHTVEDLMLAELSYHRKVRE